MTLTQALDLVNINQSVYNKQYPSVQFKKIAEKKAVMETLEDDLLDLELLLESDYWFPVIIN